MLVLIFVLSCFLILFRILYLILYKSEKKLGKKCAKTLIVIGSGGHTHEMLTQVKTLNPDCYKPRLYVMADVDTNSEYKIKETEQGMKGNEYDIVKIPRSRVVNQSYITSIFSTFYSTLKCIPILLKFKPDLILCNGPGTCIPVCVIAFLLNALFYCQTKIVFIESVCRVVTLSLSGKILLYLADVVIVQWEDLHKRYPRTLYLGRLA